MLTFLTELKSHPKKKLHLMSVGLFCKQSDTKPLQWVSVISLIINNILKLMFKQ